MVGDSKTLGDGGMVAFHFEPVDPEDVFDDQGESSNAEAFRGGPPGKTRLDHISGSHGRESIFDEASANGISANGNSGKTLAGRPLHHKDIESFFDETMRGQFGLMDPSSDPDNIIMMSEQVPIAPASIPASTLRNLFPGPGFVIEDDDTPPMPFGTPDMAVMDMLQQMDTSFAQNLLPIAHRAAGTGHTANSCGPEIREYCRRAPSQLHCLGQNNLKISDKCREDIGKSVPFACSSEIDKWCNLLEKGILDCLGGHLQELQDDCRDAVVATHHVISRAKSQRASVIDPVTGTQKVNVPKPKQTPQQREANFDAQLGSSEATKTPGTKSPRPSDAQIYAQNGDAEKDIIAKVIENMVPNISAQAEQKAESEWRDRYMKLQAEYEKLKAAGQHHPVAANITTMHTAEMQATDRINVPKSDKAAEIKDQSKMQKDSGAETVFLSQGATLVFLLLTAGVSLVMLRSQHFSKLLAAHCEPAVGLPLVKFRPQGSSEVDCFVVASGSQQMPDQ